MTENNDRTRLFTLIPTDITVRTGFIIVLFSGIGVFGFFSTVDTYQKYEAFKAVFSGFCIFIFFTAFQIYINKGYRVSYDEVALYLTRWYQLEPALQSRYCHALRRQIGRASCRERVLMPV